MSVCTSISEPNIRTSFIGYPRHYSLTRPDSIEPRQVCQVKRIQCLGRLVSLLAIVAEMKVRIRT